MGRYPRPSAEKQTEKQEKEKVRFDQAFNLFADMIIKKLESVRADWKKPWFTKGQNMSPKALYGKYYHGINALMLMLHCEDKGYRIPVFATFNYIDSLNRTKTKDGRRIPAVDANGEKLPYIHVLKGEQSFPVFLTTVNVVNKETKERIKWSEYEKLSAEEKEDYNLYRRSVIHYVFNVDQTNMKEARPELYAKLEKESCQQVMEGSGRDFVFEPLDVMVSKNLWICPITPKEQDSAFFRPSTNEIIIPTKAQFIQLDNAESYYGTMLHEMIHSTGHESQLNRLKANSDKTAYAREELIAELGAAMICSRHGMDKVIKEDSLPYLKSWLDDLHQDPSYIREVLQDLKKASYIIESKIEHVCRVELNECSEESLSLSEDGGSEEAIVEMPEALEAVAARDVPHFGFGR